MKDDGDRRAAFEAEAVKSYWLELEALVRSNAEMIFERFGDDPAKLKECFEELRKIIMEGHVMDEIRPRFDTLWNETIAGYIARAHAAKTGN